MLTRALILGVCLLFSASGSTAQVFVDGSGVPGPPDGLTWATAWPTVQEGIDDAVANMETEVLVADDNTYFPTTAFWIAPGAAPFQPGDETILLAEGVNLRGGYKGYNAGTPGSEDPNIPDGKFHTTILSGKAPTFSAYHVVVADFGNPFQRDTIVDGFKIVDGVADDTISGNLRDSGAGMLVHGSPSILVENVTFRDNVARADGGAVWARPTGGNGAFKCRFSRFRENVAARGAALFAADNVVAMRFANVVFRDNGNSIQEVGSDFPPITLKGGAVYIDFEIGWTASNCLFFDNVAREGGAVYWDPDDGNLPIVLHQYWRHCTFSFNATTSVPPNPAGLGAGIYIAPGSIPDGSIRTVHFDNCILWGNGVTNDLYLDADPSGTARGVLVDMKYTDLGTSAMSANVLTPGGITLDAFTFGSDFDPLYKNPASRNLHLQHTPGSVSLAIDAGLATLVGPDWLDIDDNGVFDTEDLPLDRDLLTRIMDAALAPGSGPDLGAYETPGLGEH